jgi:RHS repeat-associated protein
MASANKAIITYDAFGRMVENQNGTYEFAYAPTGTQPLAWLQGQTLAGTHLPLPGGAFAVYNGSGIFQYNHADWLGSARLFSTPTRTASMAMSYAPFGEGYASGIQDIQFTSYSSSFTVSGNESQGGTLDDFTFRRYSPVQGRWISPDPLGLGAVDPTNPQSWNRYAYALNNPLRFVDALGLEVDAGCSWDDASNTLTCDPGPGGDPSGGDSCFLYGMGCPSQPPNGPGGGDGPESGGGGGSTPAKNCTPLTKGCSNVPTAEQQCISNFYNSNLGTAAALGSPLALLPGWNPQWGSNLQEWGIAVFGKVGGLFGSGAMSGTTQLTTLSGTATVGSTLELGPGSFSGQLRKWPHPQWLLRLPWISGLMRIARQ